MHLTDFIERIKHVQERSGGSGLGLSIAYMITQLHKGNIKISQNQPKGTKVIVKL